MTINVKTASYAELLRRQAELAEADEKGGTPLREQMEWHQIERELMKRAEGEPMVIQQERDRSSRPKPPNTLAYFDQQKKEWMSAKGRDEIAVDLQRDNDRPSFGGMIKGFATGNWTGLEREKAAVLGNVDGSGGFLVGEANGPRVIPYAFAQTVVGQAGAKMISFPAGVDTLKIGRVLAPPTVYARTEGQAITASSPTFEAIVLTKKVFATLVPVSLEWLSDVSNGQQLLEEVIAQAIRTEIDRQILYGTGAAGDLSGLATMTGVNKTTGVGVWTTETLINQAETIWNANGPRNGLSCILDSDAESHRLKLVDGNGQYIVGQANPAQDLQYLMTENVTSGDMFIGDFSRVVVAVADSMRVEVLPAGTGTDAAGTSYNATDSMYRWIRVFTRLDAACEKPEHICYLTGLTNS